MCIRDRPYAAQSFDVVIVSNALHIVPEPAKALAEIHRVLKNDGVLIAPPFTHANNHVRGRVKAFLMKLAGFHLSLIHISEAVMEEKSPDTLEKIQQSALEEFSEKGFLGASLRQIVKNAGVTTGAVSYTHLDVYKRQL